MRAVPFVLAFALMLYAFIDCARAPREDLPAGLSRLVWVLLILLLPGFGALVWIVLRVATAGGATVPHAPAPRAPGRPVAPDDDPTFLAGLARQRRREERRRREQDQRGHGATGGRPRHDGGARRGDGAAEDRHDDARGDGPGDEGGSTTGRPEDGGSAH